MEDAQKTTSKPGKFIMFPKSPWVLGGCVADFIDGIPFPSIPDKKFEFLSKDEIENLKREEERKLNSAAATVVEEFIEDDGDDDDEEEEDDSDEEDEDSDEDDDDKSQNSYILRR